MSRPPQARMDLLTRLLDAYERSSSYGSQRPWRRDIIVRLDTAAFPEAFAPDGRERHAELMSAAQHLEREGSVRMVRHVRGPLTEQPKELRLGPAELHQAYASAAAFGYEPLALGLSRLERHARGLEAQPDCEAIREFLEKLANRLPVGICP